MTQTQTFKYAAQGARIKAARGSVSHDKFAAQVGTSRQHLIKLEKGQHRARPDMLSRIAEAAGVPLAELADDEDEEEQMRQKAELFDALAARVAEIVATQNLDVRRVA